MGHSTDVQTVVKDVHQDVRRDVLRDVRRDSYLVLLLHVVVLSTVSIWIYGKTTNRSSLIGPNLSVLRTSRNELVSRPNLVYRRVLHMDIRYADKLLDRGVKLLFCHRCYLLVTEPQELGLKSFA